MNASINSFSLFMVSVAILILGVASSCAQEEASEEVVVCTLELSCPKGSRCDVATGKCLCETSEACPSGYSCNALTGDCICSSDECCPEGYRYRDTVCICQSDLCCPEGFAYDPQKDQCTCRDENSCPEGFKCDGETGQCLCQSDSACEEGGFCNEFGFCQRRVGCLANSDCPQGKICDAGSHSCMDEGKCSASSQCALGKICRTASGTCSDGCDSTDDCPIGAVCRQGACVQGICESHTYCEFEEFCNAGSGECYPAVGEYCKPCNSGMDCADENMCLRRIVEGQEETFCGVVCASSEDCPSGYGCGAVYIPCNPILGCPQGTFCKTFQVINEPEPIDICSDPATGLPKETARLCSPTTGSCSQ